MSLRACALMMAALAPCAAADIDVPSWVLHGILAVETASHYTPAGDIVYVDRKRTTGAGPFQIERAAFDQVAKPGESYRRLLTSYDFGEEVALRYLRWLHKNFGHKHWAVTVARYHVGPHGSISETEAIDYADRAYNAGIAAVGGRQ